MPQNPSEQWGSVLGCVGSPKGANSSAIMEIRMSPMIGSIPPNLHEGSRSEYLAQYVFSSLGTSTPVPHQEDNGLDLYCTLMESVGRRWWPSAYFAVQVKSTDDPWIFESAESVRWLVEFPLPMFFCIVTKKKARLRIFQTLPRYFAWSHPPLPDKLTLVPSEESGGRFVSWSPDTIAKEPDVTLSLSAPILDFTIENTLDKSFHDQLKKVLTFWIAIDNYNRNQIQTGVRLFSMPASYETNKIPHETAVVTQGGAPSEEDVQDAIGKLNEQLQWIGERLWTRDRAGALRILLLHRHLYPSMRPMSLIPGLIEITRALNISPAEFRELPGGSVEFAFAGIDAISRMIDERYPGSSHAN
jgi:hypothetical protein